ncbi:MAG: hypothetical protein H6576_07030 [Lewinellaceae bacterium]|nr:hypothetical protein [Bacteroidota bacterium]MCB9343432.1 hypothetical protein [Lewinellaceae bacterium]
MKVSIKGFITCKSAEDYIDCADNYAVNKSIHRFSVSDGVSKSFFPKVWSEILVTQFVERTDLKETELIKVCQEEWQKRIDKIVKSFETDPTKWSTRTLYNRKEPALATFVGLQFFEKEKKWSASALGDSFLFFVPMGYKDYQKELVKLSSKVEPIEFDNFPDYLTSIGDSHKGRPKEKSGNLKNGTFYLMTDALAEWFIKEGENAIGKITVWKSQADFERFITQAIEQNQLTNDDCAILCIELSEVEKTGIDYSKIQVTDLNDLITDQEAEKEKIKQKKLEEEKRKQEKEAEIQKSKEFETTQNESQTPESPVKEIKEVPPSEGFISKGINAVKGFLTSKEKEENKKTELQEEKTSAEEVDIEKQTLEQQEPTTEEPSNSESTVAENQNSENDKNEEPEVEKIEEEAKSEKIEPEKLEPKEQPKVDSKAKNIFDKF